MKNVRNVGFDLGVMARDRGAGLGTGVVTAKLLYDLYN